MLVAKFVTEKPDMSASRTYEDFSKFLGVRPERLGIVSRLYPELTASFLTESLMNVYYNEKKPSKFKSINAFMFEWDVDVQFIDRIEFAAVPERTVGQEYDVTFVKRYYEKYDTFIIDGSRQTMICLSAPTRNADGTWTSHCQLIDADYANTLDMSYCQPGCTTRFMSNYHPEYHEEGLICV
jgi:hypothetical protein